MLLSSAVMWPSWCSVSQSHTPTMSDLPVSGRTMRSNSRMLSERRDRYVIHIVFHVRDWNVELSNKKIWSIIWFDSSKRIRPWRVAYHYTISNRFFFYIYTIKKAFLVWGIQGTFKNRSTYCVKISRVYIIRFKLQPKPNQHSQAIHIHFS